MSRKEFYVPRTVSIGGMGKTLRLDIGGASPISIQTMWKEGITFASADVDALFSIRTKIEELESLGCNIIRFAVPDQKSADNLIRIASEVSMPVVADIHFDYTLALRCLDGNIAKIRINPGNIGSKDKVKAVVEKAYDKGVAIRIGVNSGSLPKDLMQKVNAHQLTRAEALAETASREVECLEELNFSNVIVSMKASSVSETIEANEAFARKYNYPLHIGVTEAGPLIGGVVKSTLALSHLLLEGVGSTMRVSLSSAMLDEVITAREILSEIGLRNNGVRIVSCPRCGRNGFDVHSFVNRWQTELMSLDKNITVAIMGCVVNGPGEGKHADIGITGAGDTVIIFRNGETVRTVSAQEADDAFREELNKL